MKPDGDDEGKSVADLANLAGELEVKLMGLRLQKASGTLKTTADLKKTRRERARVLTRMKERAT